MGPQPESQSVWRTLAWGELAPLRLRAREVAEGAIVGAHRSVRRGAGIELGGFREYVPGDDLRWLDRRSLLRHERLIVRQFETETDRALCLLVDSSASMGFRGPNSPGSKLAFASLLAAALARIALAGGDPVSLSFIGAGDAGRSVPRSAGSEQFERIVASLESVTAGGDAYADPDLLDRGLQRLARTTRRGAIVVVLSDLLDAPPGAAERIAAMASRGCVVSVVHVLDAAEADLPYRGTVRLRALEGSAEDETDADGARSEYVARLADLSRTWERALVRRAARFQRAQTSDSPIRVVRQIVQRLR